MTSSWRGALEIVRFNWPSYVMAFVVCGICIALIGIGFFPLWASVVLAFTLYFTIASLGVSHWVYDCSPIADWHWLPSELPQPVGRWILLQAGFDSTHGRLAKYLPQSPYPVVDLYGNAGIGGASVERARKEHLKNPISTASTLPALPAPCETVFAIFCLHEIQSPEDRTAFFKALANRLVCGGQLVVVEHLRDWKNFLAFGLGFLHFLPEREWRRCAQEARFIPHSDRSITPFVRLFIWRKS